MLIRSIYCRPCSLLSVIATSNQIEMFFFHRHHIKISYHHTVGQLLTNHLKRGVSKDWKIGAPPQFPHSFMIAKIKKVEYPRYFWLSHLYRWRNVWRWMRDCENYSKKCIILITKNGETVRELMVNSRFP